MKYYDLDTPTIIEEILEKQERNKPKTKDILEKMRNEFIDRYPRNYANELELGGRSCVFSLNEILQIIDKYKVESERKE